MSHLVQSALTPSGKRRAGLASAAGLTKAGNRLHRSWDNTILGKIDVEGPALIAAVNSKPRATRLRKQIEKRLAGRVLLLRTVTESVDAMLAQARSNQTAVDALART